MCVLTLRLAAAGVQAYREGMENRDRREQITVPITDARTSHSEDLQRRQRHYLGSMLLRTVCFVGAVATEGWLRWTLVAAAIFLPYIAVVLANAASRRRPDEMTPYIPEPFGALPGGDRGQL